MAFLAFESILRINNLIEFNNLEIKFNLNKNIKDTRIDIKFNNISKIV